MSVIFKNLSSYLYQAYLISRFFLLIPILGSPKQVLKKILDGKKVIFFVQIGSNDGKSGDPIRELALSHPSWEGILVEPVPFLFKRLQENYKSKERFLLKNVAIGKESGTREFYYLPENAPELVKCKLPYYFNQVGSFSKEHLIKHFGPQIEPGISAEELPTLTLSDLIASGPREQVDLLHVDTEGYDYYILKQLKDLPKLPSIILFEYIHSTKDQLEEIKSDLEQEGYQLRKFAFDILAVRHPK